MTFSVLIWNIWLNNQIHGVAKSGSLLHELSRLIKQYQPDIIGLNEVLQATHSSTPFVADFLKNECGYMYNHFAPASPYTDDWIIGAGLYSRYKINTVRDVPISKDSPAEKRGYNGYELKAITAQIQISEKHKINIIVAHPMHIQLHTLIDHFTGAANLKKLIRSKEFLHNTIVGGDINEPTLMPRALKSKVRGTMEYRTGTLLNPTWRHNAHRYTPIRANLDHIYWSKQSTFELVDFKVIHSDVSDHRPIIATFKFK